MYRGPDPICIAARTAPTPAPRPHHLRSILQTVGGGAWEAVQETQPDKTE